MQDLHLVGYTTDRRHLIFSARKGAKSGGFLVPVDDTLLAAIEDLGAAVAEDDELDEEQVEEVPAAPRVDAQLSVREVQARLRAGDAVGGIATDAGVDVEWVERFAAPVRAEQRQIVERALQMHMERPRSGRSSAPLRRAVAAAMADRGVPFTAESFESAWASKLIGVDKWVVEFTYTHRGRERTATWTIDTDAGVLSTTDRTASQLGFVPDGDDVPPESETIGAHDSAPTAARPASQRPRGTSGSSWTKATSRKKATSSRKTTKPKAAKKKATSKKATKKPATPKRTKAAPKKKAATKKRAATKAKAAPKKTKAAAKKTKAASKKTGTKKAAAKKAGTKKAAAKKADTTAVPVVEAVPPEEVVRPTPAAPERPEPSAAEPGAAGERPAPPARPVPVPPEAETRPVSPPAPRPAVAPTPAPRPPTGAVPGPGPSVADRPPPVVAAARPVHPAGPARPSPDGGPGRVASRPAQLPLAAAQDAQAAERDARRRETGERSAPTAQFRSGSATPVRRSAGDNGGTVGPVGANGAPRRVRPTPAGEGPVADGGDRSAPDGGDTSGRRPRRTRQLRAR